MKCFPPHSHVDAPAPRLRMVFEKVIKLNRSSGRALIQPACSHRKGKGAGHRQGQRPGGRAHSERRPSGAPGLQDSAQELLMLELPQGPKALLRPPPPAAVQQTVVQHPLSLTAPQAGDPRSHQGHHEEGSHVSPDAQRPGLTGHGFPLTLLTVPAVSLYLTAHCPLHPGRQGVHGEAGRNCEELWEPDTFVLSGLACQPSRHAVFSPLVVDPADTAVTPQYHNAATTQLQGLFQVELIPVPRTKLAHGQASTL